MNGHKPRVWVRWTRSRFILWKAMLPVSVVLAFFCYKRQLASVGEALLERRPDAENPPVEPNRTGNLSGVIDSSPSDLSLSISATTHRIRVAPLLLNPNDYFTIKALVNEYKKMAFRLLAEFHSSSSNEKC